MDNPTAPITDDQVAWLRDAGDSEALRALFSDDMWLRERVAQGGYDGYLADLQVAWDRAAADLLRQSEEGEPLPALIDLLRYTLIWSGVCMAANYFAPGLIARAVATGLWSPERAVSAAALSWEPERAFDVYDALLAHGNLSQAHASTVYRLMMLAAEAIEYEGMRAQAFERAAKHADAEAQTVSLLASLAAALKAADRDEYPDRYMLGQLAAELPAALLAQAVEGVRALGNADARAWVLAALARRLPDERKALVDDALAAVPAIVDATAQGLDTVMRANAIMQMADLLEGEQVSRAFEMGLMLEVWLTRAIAPLVDRLDEAQQVRALNVLLTVEDEWGRKDGLLALVRHARGQTQRRALEGLLVIGHGEAREVIRRSMAADVDPALLEAGRLFAEHIADDDQRAWALETIRTALAARDPAPDATTQSGAGVGTDEPSIDEQFAAALKIRWAEDRFPVLERLLPQLSDEQIRIVLEDAHAARGDDHLRDRLIGAIALRCAAEALPALFERAVVTWQMISDCQMLLHWGYEPPDGFMPGAITYVESCLQARLDPFTRIDLRHTLLPHLTGEAKRAHSAEALATALADEYLPGRAEHLSRIYALLDEADQPAALEALYTAVTTAYAEFAPETDAPPAPSAATDDDYYRDGRLRHVYPLLFHLDEARRAPLIEGALKLCLAFEDKRYAASVLGELGRMFDAGQLARVLEAVTGWDDAGARASVIARLRPHLSDDQLVALPDEGAVGSQHEVYRLLELAREAADEERPALLEGALAAAKLVQRLGERRAVFVDLALAGVDEALQTLVESVQYMEPGYQGQFLLSLYPRLADQPDMRATIMRGIVTQLEQIRSGNRQLGFEWFLPWSRIKPLLTPELRAQIPPLLLEIVRDWRWA
ncbi:MAG: hypothetical protein IT320_27270 [Anaerolineae bacterium]|nr:hypothetical protein [Anaerolineae bacterium]